MDLNGGCVAKTLAYIRGDQSGGRKGRFTTAGGKNRQVAAVSLPSVLLHTAAQVLLCIVTFTDEFRFLCSNPSKKMSAFRK